MSLIYAGKDWNWDKIQTVYGECERIAVEELKLDCYPNVLEIVTFEQMLDSYSSIGMPIMYSHWSFGKSFEKNYEFYRTGRMGLALEMVINSSPCINYLMEENSMTSQALVIAHAAFGHNSFFKNNYLFKQWTQADYIIDYLAFAKKYVEECEDKYGVEVVEKTLDAAHALQYNGVDRYTKPKVLSVREEIERQKERDEHYERTYDELWGLVPKNKKRKSTPEIDVFLPHGPEENLLYFLEKKSPILKSWQRELLRIVRKISQYFYPQAQTKVANEGWATTVHYYTMNRLYDKGMIDEGSLLEFLDLHTSVVTQPPFNSKHYSGFNPYALGFNILMDLKRMSDNPTAEDLQWFPDFAGGNYLENWHHAFMDYRDDSLIQQFLSPKLIRDMRLFSLEDDTDMDVYVIQDIHNDRGYKNIRNQLSADHNRGNQVPDIQVTGVDFDTRHCILTYYTDNGTLLEFGDCVKTLNYFKELWGFTVSVQTRDRETNDYIYEASTEDE